MGGGVMPGVMKVAAKVAGSGVFNVGLRGFAPDHPVSTAARKAVRPVTAFAASSSSDTLKAAAAIDASSGQKPYREIDEWELAGGEEDVLVASGEVTPRLVFGGAPTLLEAKEATTELKDALEKTYLSSPFTPISRSSGLSPSEVPETIACVTSQNIVAQAVPKHAIEAFMYLNESPAAQSVVASIVSDPNVWTAVFLNPTLQDYLQSQKISAPFSNTDQYEKAPTADGDILCPKSPKSFEVSSDFAESDSAESDSAESDSAESDSGESIPNNGFTDFWKNLKLTVIDMMNSLSDYFQTPFGGFSGNKVAANANGFMDKALGPSLMGLAVMVIMVVVLKRTK